MVTATHTKSLRTREHKVLLHLARYRITNHEAVANVVLPQESRDGLRRFLSGMMKEGLLGRAGLFRNQTYFYLTEAGRELLGERSDVSCGPLSELAKVRAFATLAFCCLAETPREAITREDFQTHFSDLYRPGLAMNYYIDTNGAQPRLGFLRIDTGGTGRWDRIVGKARHDSEVHWLSGAFRRLINKGSFQITIITALPQKAQRIREALGDAKHKLRTDINVVAIPDLLHLVLPPPLPNPNS